MSDEDNKGGDRGRAMSQMFKKSTDEDVFQTARDTRKTIFCMESQFCIHKVLVAPVLWDSKSLPQSRGSSEL